MAHFADIEPHSPSHRTGLYLATHPGISLPRPDVASLLGIAPGAVDRALMPAVDQGIITMANDGHDGRVWRAGPRMQQWVSSLKDQPPAPAARPVATAAASTRANKPRGHLPPLDLGAVKVVTDAPMPPNRITRQGHTRYEALLDKLTADGMALTGIPIDYRGALTKSIAVYLKARPTLAATSGIVMRTLDAKTVGLWRMPKAEADALTPGPRKARTPKTTTAKA